MHSRLCLWQTPHSGNASGPYLPLKIRLQWNKVRIIDCQTWWQIAKSSVTRYLVRIHRVRDLIQLCYLKGRTLQFLSAHHVGSLSILKALTLFLSPIGRIRLCRLRFSGQICWQYHKYIMGPWCSWVYNNWCKRKCPKCNINLSKLFRVYNR